MSLVGVEHLGGLMAGQPAVRSHRPYAPDPQQHLLKQPVLAAAAVQPVGDVALAGTVLLDVRVEHQQWYAADLRHPDVGVQGAPAGERERYPGGCPFGLPQQADRQFVGVEEG